MKFFAGPIGMARTPQQKYEFAKWAVVWCDRGMRLFVWIAFMTIPLLVIVPKIERAFDDIDRETPAAIAFVFNLTRWLGGRRYPDQVVPGIVWLVVLLVPFGLATWWFRRMVKRYTPGLCIHCGYDLTGTIAAGRTECPECGKAFGVE